MHHGGRPCTAIRTFEEVAAKLGCTKQAVQMAEIRALRKMRLRLIDMGIKL